MQARTTSKDESGFTLVEVIVALMVIAIGILGLATVFPLATEDVGKSGLRTKATELCQEKLEDLHALAYDAPDLDAGAVHADSLNPIDDVYQRTWEVFEDQPINGCKLIEVSVEWESYSEGSIQLSTVIASAGR
jgi:type IV pilus assembly protein PilV